MSHEFIIIVITASVTAVLGISAMVIGNIIISFVVEPIKTFKSEIGNVSDHIVFYAAVLSNPAHIDSSNAYTAFRRASSSLRAKSYRIPQYNYLSKFKFLPTRKKLDSACKALISLSNCVTMKDELVIAKAMEQIEKDLEVIRESLDIQSPSG